MHCEKGHVAVALVAHCLKVRACLLRTLWAEQPAACAAASCAAFSFKIAN